MCRMPAGGGGVSVAAECAVAERDAAGYQGEAEAGVAAREGMNLPHLKGEMSGTQISDVGQLPRGRGEFMEIL